MEKLYLAELSSDHKKEFERMVLGYKKYGETDYYEMYKEGLVDFNKYIEKLENRKEGIGLPKWWGPYFTYWLMDDHKGILGSIRIRKELTSEFLKNFGGHIGYDISPSHRKNGYGRLILKLGLEKTRQININPVLITCEPDNYASMRVIEANGGVFESEIVYDVNNRVIRRYWIDM